MQTINSPFQQDRSPKVVLGRIEPGYVDLAANFRSAGSRAGDFYGNPDPNRGSPDVADVDLRG